jgi:hypothetical protein
MGPRKFSIGSEQSERNKLPAFFSEQGDGVLGPIGRRAGYRREATMMRIF